MISSAAIDVPYVFKAHAGYIGRDPVYHAFYSKVAVITPEMLDLSKDVHLSLRDSIVIVTSELNSKHQVTIEGKVVILTVPITASKINVLVTQMLLYLGEDSLTSEDVTLIFRSKFFKREFEFMKGNRIAQSIDAIVSGSKMRNQATLGQGLAEIIFWVKRPTFKGLIVEFDIDLAKFLNMTRC